MSKIENTHDRGISTVYVMDTLLNEIEEEDISVENRFHISKKQWSEEARSNLIVSIFNDYQFPPIIIAKIIQNNFAYSFVIDGIQRINSCLDFKNNKFKIFENSERATVSYYRRTKDEKGDVVLKLDEFDLRDKFYKDLPKELQDKFGCYNIQANVYSPCTEEDIKFHIKRYNSTIL